MTGSLIKRSKHSYTLKLELDKDPITGKRRQKWITFKGNKKQAQNELTRLLNEVNTGVFVEPAKMTVSEFLDRWVKDYAEVNVSGKTLERYKRAIEKQIKPALGHLPIQKLTPLHIQTFYSDCMKDGGRKDGRKGAPSAQTVLHFHRLLFQALKHALRWRLLARNPAEAVEPPRVPQKKWGFLTIPGQHGCWKRRLERASTFRSCWPCARASAAERYLPFAGRILT